MPLMSHKRIHDKPKIMKIYLYFVFYKFYSFSLSFRSLIHLEFIFYIYMVWGKDLILSFCMCLSNCLNSICWKGHSFSHEWSWYSCWKSVEFTYGFIFELSIPFHWSICLPYTDTTLSLYFMKKKKNKLGLLVTSDNWFGQFKITDKGREQQVIE